MIYKKLAITILGACMAISSSVVLSETLKISHIRPQNTVTDTDIKAFAKDVADADDSIKFNIFAANALGDYTDVQERVSLGTVEMALQPISSAADRKLQLGLLPYLATDWQEAYEVYGPDAEIRKEIESLYAKQGIKVMAAYPVYFGGISLNEDPGNINAESEDHKRLKLRVPPFKTFSLLADSLGFISAPIPFAEAFTAVQTGVVDGVIGSGAEGYYNSFRDVTKYYIPLNTHFEVWYLLLNQDKFDSLNDKQQQALLDAAAKFETDRWQVAEEDQKVNENKLVEVGAKIIEVSPEKLEKSKNDARNKVWPEIMNDMGKDWAEPILSPLMDK